MDVQKISNNVRMQKWMTIIDECSKSEISVKTWCSQNDISEQSYYEFLLTNTNEEEQATLLEIMESRCGNKSTIFCSQFSPEGWHSKLGSGAIADSILDRIINTSYKIFIDGEQSMRQRKLIIK